MQKTRIATLVWASLFAVPIGWSISRLVHSATAALPPIPAVLPAFLAVFAVMMFLGARAVRGWIEERRHDRHLGALRVARILALAKAAEFFGAVIAGAYVGVAIVSVDHLAVPMGTHALLMAGLVVAGAALSTVAAVVLERACVVPRPPEDDQPRS